MKKKILFFTAFYAAMCAVFCAVLLLAGCKGKTAQTSGSQAAAASQTPAGEQTASGNQTPAAKQAPAIVPVPDSMVRISGGTFLMGSPANEPGRFAPSEGPQHQVTVSTFYMAKYPVTQAEFYEMTGDYPSYFSGDNLPVDSVTWFEAVEYCNRLSICDGLTPAYVIDGDDVTWYRNVNGYRLPTEAEWEYACRAGTTTPFYTGNNITTDQANYNGNDPYNNNPKGINREKTTEVGSFPPNPWGLYDMSGNVWEWCWDWMGDYTNSAEKDPVGPASGSARVIRGGVWYFGGTAQRSANRASNDPETDFSEGESIGFRLVRNAD